MRGRRQPPPDGQLSRTPTALRRSALHVRLLKERLQAPREPGVDAQRRERPVQGGTDHGALARATLGW